MSDQVRQDEDSEDLLLSRYGARSLRGWRRLEYGVITDTAFDARLFMNQTFRGLARRASQMPVRRVHVASVDVPSRREGLKRVVDTLNDTHHEVTVSLAPLGDRGKFQNINLALAEVDLSEVDWLIVTDDDLAFPRHFLDRFLYVSEAAGLKIAQPAHRFRSHTSWALTQRIWNSLAHRTHFVECGPLTAFHRDVFSFILPFPETRWAWGLDAVWGEIARREGFEIGVVDATPIEHLRPIAETYDSAAAISEARALLASFGVNRSNRDILKIIAVLTSV